MRMRKREYCGCVIVEYQRQISERLWGGRGHSHTLLNANCSTLCWPRATSICILKYGVFSVQWSGATTYLLIIDGLVEFFLLLLLRWQLSFDGIGRRPLRLQGGRGGRVHRNVADLRDFVRVSKGLFFFAQTKRRMHYTGPLRLTSDPTGRVATDGVLWGFLVVLKKPPTQFPTPCHRPQSGSYLYSSCKHSTSFAHRGQSVLGTYKEAETDPQSDWLLFYALSYFRYLLFPSRPLLSSCFSVLLVCIVPLHLRFFINSCVFYLLGFWLQFRSWCPWILISTKNRRPLYLCSLETLSTVFDRNFLSVCLLLSVVVGTLFPILNSILLSISQRGR